MESKKAKSKNGISRVIAKVIGFIARAGVLFVLLGGVGYVFLKNFSKVSNKYQKILRLVHAKVEQISRDDLENEKLRFENTQIVMKRWVI